VSIPTTKRRKLAVIGAIVTAAAVLAAVLFFTTAPATAKEFATLHPLSGTVDVAQASARTWGSTGSNPKHGCPAGFWL
jgi:hypothetical protein